MTCVQRIFNLSHMHATVDRRVLVGTNTIALFPYILVYRSIYDIVEEGHQSPQSLPPTTTRL